MNKNSVENKITALLAFIRNHILKPVNLTVEYESGYAGFTVMANGYPVYRGSSLSRCWNYIANTVDTDSGRYFVEGEPSDSWCDRMSSKGLIHFGYCIKEV